MVVTQKSQSNSLFQGVLSALGTMVFSSIHFVRGNFYYIVSFAITTSALRRKFIVLVEVHWMTICYF